jgi:predicted ferric reductase
MLIVVALWVRGRGVQDLGGVASGLTSLGRLTGLVSADLLLVQVLLMARVPWVERSYGQDRLARWHHVTGFTSFNLVLAHVFLIIIGYAAAERAGLLAETWLLATAAIVALTMVVVTSPGWRRSARSGCRWGCSPTSRQRS